ncbi:MAG: permease-like cell division protein FtsX [Schwartzia sp.]|nr:permease-like cell division protein FtsX [Schwartzia sp. (in: firmicutes)]
MKFSTIEYVIREVFFSFRRNSWMAIASVSTVAVSLFVFGMFLVIVMNMNKMIDTLESQVEISVYLEDSVAQAQIGRVEEKIASMQGIAEVRFIDRDTALARFRERLGEQQFLLDALGEKNPLPNGFEVRVHRPDMVKTAAAAIGQIEGVEVVKYGQDVVEHLFDITRLIRIFGVALMFLLAGATLFIISNTIRLTVIARRKEIAIMKYVGATDWFIRWPFLLEGVFLGCIGGLVAAAVLWGAYGMITAKVYETLAFFPLIPAHPFLLYILLVILVCGVLIGALGSTISLKRFLKA